MNAARGDGLTALHLAAEGGHRAVADALVAAGAAVDAGTRIGRYTPLHMAAEGGHGAVALRLLEAGADPNARATNSGVTALHLAAGAIDGRSAVAALLDHGADANAREGSAGQTPLIFAAVANRPAAVTALLAAGADPGITTAVVDVLPALALDREANRRFRDLIGAPPQTLGPFGPRVDPDAESPGEPSPAQVQAAVRAQRDFLRSGYDVGDVSPHSLGRVGPDYPGGPDVVRPPYREVLVGRTGAMTALLHAAREGHIEAAMALAGGGAEPGSGERGRHQPTPDGGRSTASSTWRSSSSSAERVQILPLRRTAPRRSSPSSRPSGRQSPTIRSRARRTCRRPNTWTCSARCSKPGPIPTPA